jgi:hypothetical protein
MFGGYDMSFVDTATGCAAVDDVDTVMKTTDAGNSWTGHAYIPGARRIQMFDKLSGWVLADSGLLRTSNGGDSWTLVVAETALTALRFCDAGFGVAVGKGGAILRTNDSGATWHRDTVDNPVNLYAVCVLDSTHAWAAGDEGVVLGLGDRSIPHIDEPVQAYRGLGVGRLWPNPCSGTLWLRVGGKSGLVHVYDDSGRRVRTVSCASDRTLEVDVSDLPTGVYIARFAAQRSANVRFVILRYRPRPGCS